MHTVSLPFFPLMRTVSPRKSCSSSILAGERVMTELSSLSASSTMRRLGDRFLPPNTASFMSASLLFVWLGLVIGIWLVIGGWDVGDGDDGD